MASSRAYGQLVSTTDPTSEPIEIDEDKFSIGRKASCDLCLAGNKLISGSHGYLERDADGKVWFHDTSTNGSLLNMSQKVNKDKVELKHGDEIHLVYRKADPAVNVAYLYQDLKTLAEEEADCTQEYSSDLESTSADDKNKVSPVSKKRPAEASDPEEKTNLEPATKKAKTQETGEIEGTEKDQGDSNQKTKEEETTAEPAEPDAKKEKVETKAKSSGEASGVGTSTGTDAFEETLICIICQEILHDCISLQPCMHSFCAGCYSDWMDRSSECPSCRMNVDRINKNHIVNNLVEAYLKQNPSRKRPDEDIKELDAKNKITRDMLYPGEKKSLESDDEDEEEDSYDDGSDPEDRDVDDGGIQPPLFGTPVGYRPLGILPTSAPFTGFLSPPKTVCRQCPEYKGPHPAHGTPNSTLGNAVAAVGGAVAKVVGMVTGSKTDGDNSAAEPSTSTGASTSKDDASTSDDNKKSLPDAKIIPTPAAFTCTPYQTHILCNCCMQPMPDRRIPAAIPGNNIPPISCAVCSRAFCHAYWGCVKADCMGCIGKFGEMNFGKRALTGLILDNVYESEVFKVYVETKGWSVKDVLQKCMDKLESKHYTCPDQNRFRIDSAQILCYACGLRNFKELAYQLRRDIPRSELPGKVTSRSNCYWGKNCRTARNKPHHAERFNHICDQTRTGT